MKRKFQLGDKVFFLSYDRVKEGFIFDWIVFGSGKIYYWIIADGEPKPMSNFSDCFKIVLETLYPAEKVFSSKKQLLKSL